MQQRKSTKLKTGILKKISKIDKLLSRPTKEKKNYQYRKKDTLLKNSQKF